MHSFLAAIYAGGTMVIQRRWDPLDAARLVERYHCTHWDNVPTMVVDLLSHPEALEHDLASLKSQTHINPAQNPKQQCLGIPTFDTEALVVDPVTLEALPMETQGEILVRGPQVFTGSWKNAKATADAFCDIGGKRFFRTGDLGRTDEDGYFYLSDRLKRMINAAGFKVWPAEVEAAMYKHPACSSSATRCPAPLRAS